MLQLWLERSVVIKLALLFHVRHVRLIYSRVSSVKCYETLNRSMPTHHHLVALAPRRCIAVAAAATAATAATALDCLSSRMHPTATDNDISRHR
jgi:hypothetical protein